MRCLSLAAFLSLAIPSLAISTPEQNGLLGTAAYPKIVREAEQARTARDFAKAAQLFEEAVKLNPVEGSAWARLGRTYYDLKQYSKAIAPYAKAIELGSGFRWAHAYDIACCYALDGKKAEAFEWLDESMKMGWRDLQHMRTDEDLVTLREDPRFVEMAATKDVSKMSRDEAWRYDLWLLDREIRRKHFNPYRYHSKQQFDAYVAKLRADIPKLADGQVMAAFMRLCAMCADGHTGARPQDTAIKAAPIQMFWFREGIFVTAASPAHADLAGAKVLKVEGRLVEDIASQLRALISRDNEMGTKSLAPLLMTVPALLHAMGIAQSPDKLTFAVLDSAGKSREVTIEGGDARPTKEWATARKDAKSPEPLTLKDRDKPYWFEYLPERKLVWFQYNSVRNDPQESTAKFAERLEKFVAENDVQRVVVDVRWNGGGNSFLNMPILHAIVRMTKVNQPGRLFVITGRNTFSACMNFATDLDMHTHAMFVGEPTGSSPNFIGETVRMTLPHSKMLVSISDLYWGRGWPMDYRTWIAPSLYAPPVFELYKANRDPAMEAILSYLDENP